MGQSAHRQWGCRRVGRGDVSQAPRRRRSAALRAGEKPFLGADSRACNTTAAITTARLLPTSRLLPARLLPARHPLNHRRVASPSQHDEHHRYSDQAAQRGHGTRPPRQLFLARMLTEAAFARPTADMQLELRATSSLSSLPPAMSTVESFLKVRSAPSLHLLPRPISGERS